MPVHRLFKCVLLGVLLALPAGAACVYATILPLATVVTPPLKSAPVVAVEVVTDGGQSQWIAVQIQAQAVPEPGSALLAVLGSLLLLRRRR